MERLAEKRAKERQPILRRKNGKKSLLVVLLVSFTPDDSTRAVVVQESIEVVGRVGVPDSTQTRTRIVQLPTRFKE